MLSGQLFRRAVLPVFWQNFQKFIQSPTRKFVNCLLHKPITFNNVQIFHQNLIFLAETHVNTEPLATDDGLVTKVPCTTLLQNNETVNYNCDSYVRPFIQNH